jgi:hypothetical protein
MKKKIVFIALAWSVLVACRSWSEEGDVVIKLPEELMPPPKPLSEAEKQRKDKEMAHSALVERLNRKLPYHKMFADVTCQFFTLGQLVKLCDSVSVVNVVAVEDADSKSATKRLVPRIKVTVNAETNLLGHLDRGDLSLIVQWWDRKRLPQKGDRWLVFITGEDHRVNMLDAMKWDFDKTKARGEVKEAKFVLGQSRGAIDLPDVKAERELLTATMGYLQNLRQQKWDAEKYYAHLRELVLSLDQRIKDDATIDMLNFLKSCPSFDLNRVLGDTNIDESVKDYVRLILMPSRQHQEEP